MYTKIIIKLEKTGNKKMSINMSSIFQGILMEHLDEETAEWLHGQQRRPYSQYISFDNKFVYWTIMTNTYEAFERIIVPMLDNENEEFLCRYHNITFKVVDRVLEQYSQEEFLEQNYNIDYCDEFKVEFITPTSFKSCGKYWNYPTVRWIFQSLINKCEGDEMTDYSEIEDLLEDLENNIQISQYNLKSTLFRLEGSSVPAFEGWIMIKVKGRQELINFVNYLLHLGEFTGVGIKSAIGMGAIKVESKKKIQK